MPDKFFTLWAISSVLDPLLFLQKGKVLLFIFFHQIMDWEACWIKLQDDSVVKELIVQACRGQLFPPWSWFLPSEVLTPYTLPIFQSLLLSVYSWTYPQWPWPALLDCFVKQLIICKSIAWFANSRYHINRNSAPMWGHFCPGGCPHLRWCCWYSKLWRLILS